ncbi:Dynein light chain Tctex-type 3 [Actinomortierella ambigua]|uniref:Dynein light chain Tctex-type 3 n=1 Tax=Actinomortierella ambigua TaxID=1343610 RepID=A0A9P6PRC6_9FUNG|nr:Dynein light chain Tctex-type 3 [Actinomortierella ambigua]KAG0252456.1 Dynein light chain Tctex-type 3 [Actinomortierella ambigua]
MASEESSTKPKFDTKVAAQILEEVTKKVLRDAVYRADRVSEWQAAINHDCITRLTQIKGTFKYIVTSTILEPVGAGVHATSTSLWDAETDGSTVYRHDGKGVIAIVQAFGLAV